MPSLVSGSGSCTGHEHENEAASSAAASAAAAASLQLVGSDSTTTGVAGEAVAATHSGSGSVNGESTREKTSIGGNLGMTEAEADEGTAAAVARHGEWALQYDDSFQSYYWVHGRSGQSMWAKYPEEGGTDNQGTVKVQVLGEDGAA